MVGFQVSVGRHFRDSNTLVLQLKLQPTGPHNCLSSLHKGSDQGIQDSGGMGETNGCCGMGDLKNPVTITRGRLKNEPGEDLKGQTTRCPIKKQKS